MMDWGNREQEVQDSEGKAPDKPKGTRVTFLPEKKNGTVLHQKLQYDGWDSFFGNLIVRMDDGELIEGNSWQFKKIEGI